MHRSDTRVSRNPSAGGLRRDAAIHQPLSLSHGSSPATVLRPLRSADEQYQTTTPLATAVVVHATVG